MRQPAMLDEWLETRRPEVQALAKRFPFDAIYDFLGRPHYLIGFGFGRNDSPLLILTTINPALDYAGARKARLYVAAEHFETPEGTRH